MLDKQVNFKSILWLKHNELRDNCISVLNELGIKTLKQDIGEEDFWFLNDEGSVGSKNKMKNWYLLCTFISLPYSKSIILCIKTNCEVTHSWNCRFRNVDFTS